MMRMARCVILLILVSGAISTLAKAQALERQFAVITNPKNTVGSISSRQLRKLLLGEDKFWESHTPVYLILRDGSSPEGQFAMKQIASMSPADYRQYWNAKVFRGEATEQPLIVPSNGLASGLVASRVGSICIIPAANVPKDASVKLLRVDGKLPGESGYPLRQ